MASLNKAADIACPSPQRRIPFIDHNLFWEMEKPLSRQDTPDITPPPFWETLGKSDRSFHTPGWTEEYIIPNLGHQSDSKSPVLETTRISLKSRFEDEQIPQSEPTQPIEQEQQDEEKDVPREDIMRTSPPFTPGQATLNHSFPFEVSVHKFEAPSSKTAFEYQISFQRDISLHSRSHGLLTSTAHQPLHEPAQQPDRVPNVCSTCSIPGLPLRPAFNRANIQRGSSNYRQRALQDPPDRNSKASGGHAFDLQKSSKKSPYGRATAQAAGAHSHRPPPRASSYGIRDIGPDLTPNPTLSYTREDRWRAEWNAQQSLEKDKNLRFLKARGHNVACLEISTELSGSQNPNVRAQLLREEQLEIDRQNGRGRKGTRWFRPSQVPVVSL